MISPLLQGGGGYLFEQVWAHAGLYRWEKKTKTMQFKLNTWQFAGSNTKTITPCLSESHTKVSTTAKR